MRALFTLATLVAVVSLAGCAGMMHGSDPTAMARLEPTRGSTTAGVAMFHQREIGRAHV